MSDMIIINDSTDHLPNIYNGYRKATKQDNIDANVLYENKTNEFDAFFENGTKLSNVQRMLLMVDTKYSKTPYLNEKNEIKACIFSNTSDRQKRAFQDKVTELSYNRNLIDKPLANFLVTDIYGKVYSSESLKGKIVVMNCWFLTCNPCLQEMPELKKLTEKYQDKEIVFLALGLDSKQEIEKFIVNNSFGYNMIADSKAITKQLDLNNYPNNIVVDKDGIVKYARSGYKPGYLEGMEKVIVDLLN
jgi:peroxiredoxin